MYIHLCMTGMPFCEAARQTRPNVSALAVCVYATDCICKVKIQVIAVSNWCSGTSHKLAPLENARLLTADCVDAAGQCILLGSLSFVPLFVRL